MPHSSSDVQNGEGDGVQRRKSGTTRITDQQRQRQRDREFTAHKSSILANLQSNACDLSPKGSVDVKCLPVMDLLNHHTDYITTSSCSGRIALFHSIPAAEVVDAALGSDSEVSKRGMKRGDPAALGWLLVKHGALLPEEMKRVVFFLCGPAITAEDEQLDASMLQEAITLAAAADAVAFEGELEGVLVEEAATSSTGVAPAVPHQGTVSLKMEPFVMHVECRTMEAAKSLLTAAVSDSGYRNSGVVPPGKKIMCGIRCAAGLGMEVPVVLDGVNHVAPQRAYVWALLKLVNEKMVANQSKLSLLEKSVAARVVAQPSS